MGQIISIINDKGGVAKTTTTANLGTALWLLGKKVLLVDTDQQCNLTYMMDKTSLEPDENGETHTLWEWIQDIEDVPLYTRYDGLDYIPSSRHMVGANEYLNDKMRRESYLEKRLAPLRSQYDYILVDCAPGGKNWVNTNVLATSDGVIIPAEADYFSIQGTPNLLEFIHSVREEMGVRLPIIGYLIVCYDENTKLGKAVRNFYKTNENQLDGRALPVPIRRCQKCRESVGDEMTLFEFAPSCTAAEDYMRVAEYLIGNKPRKKNWNAAVWGKKAQTAHKQFINERNEQ